MRYTTIRTDWGTTAGRVDGEHVVHLPFADVGDMLASGPDWRALTDVADDGSAARTALVEADFAPLVPRPEKIFCVGANYADHALEVGLPLPKYPALFAKFSRSLIGARDDLVLPPESNAVDWEAELGVVIGQTTRRVDEAQAAEAIAGYTIVNDVSMRDWQLRTSQFLQGKTFEASTPVGPFLVTPDELDHQSGLKLGCSVDGIVMQEAVTSDLVFSVAHIIAYISRFVTLVPGDLIATGTPAGVGGARRPPVYLGAGQVLRTWVDGLGEQVNRCLPTPEEA
ncbi:hypothetical protein GCM10023205_53930 [Yinghuangia aomiensis]|uniref:Fumarylacetoacetase-like C-terminal domain-containing protein n=1 Tax=Yinghuangia aomiensis TaxID=676205 RepID=A0ABP9HV62_9ACTN